MFRAGQPASPFRVHLGGGYDKVSSQSSRLRLPNVREPLIAIMRSLSLQFTGVRLSVVRLSMKDEINLPALFSIPLSYSITSFSLG